MQNEKSKLIKELWQKAEDALHAIYGDMPDLRILNRFYAEKMIYSKSDNIIFWDLIAELRIEAKIRGDLTRLSSTCFVANLMGAAETNPLDLHYFCPNCKNVEFVNERLLPWDLPSKWCECGSEMRPDGCGIPYELHRAKSAPWMHLSVASNFVKTAEKIIREKMQGIYRICKLTKTDFELLKLVFLPFDGNPDFEENVDTVDDKYSDFPQITIVAPRGYGDAKKLSEATGIDFDEILEGISGRYLSDPRIIDEFRKAHVGGILGFDWFRHPRAFEIKDQLIAASPKNTYDLLKYLGTMQGTSNWWDNAERLVKNGICSIGDIPSHKDDIFTVIRDKLRDSGCDGMGIAYNISRKVGMGIYSRCGMSAEERAILESLDLPDWFIPYIEKISYMSSKAVAVGTLRIALAFMWYKINYREAFDACVESMLKDEV